MLPLTLSHSGDCASTSMNLLHRHQHTARRGAHRQPQAAHLKAALAYLAGLRPTCVKRLLDSRSFSGLAPPSPGRHRRGAPRGTLRTAQPTPSTPRRLRKL